MWKLKIRTLQRTIHKMHETRNLYISVKTQLMNFIPQNVRITKLWSKGDSIVKNNKIDNYFYVQTSDNYGYHDIWLYHKAGILSCFLFKWLSNSEIMKCIYLFVSQSLFIIIKFLWKWGRLKTKSSI